MIKSNTYRWVRKSLHKSVYLCNVNDCLLKELPSFDGLAKKMCLLNSLLCH